MRDVRKLLEELPESHRPNFGEVMESMTSVNSEGETCVKETTRTGHFKITRDGFTLLAMGFTGKKALALNIRVRPAPQN